MPSASPARNVWLDLTVLVRGARRQPTGIPRTVARLFHCWLADGPPGLRFCQLYRESGGFVEVHREDVLARFPAKPAPTAPPDAPAPPPKSLTKKLLRPLRMLVPNRLVHEVKYAPKNLSAWLWPEPPPPPLTFGPDDLVVSGGGGWVIPESSELVWRLKQEQGFRLVTLLYDIIPILFPQFYGPGFPAYFENWNANTIWSSDLLLTISEHSRRDLEAYCADRLIPCPPIELLRLGEDIVDPDARCTPPPDAGLRPGEPFALCVGTVEVRKNHLTLYHAWRRLVERRPDAPKLVLVGAEGWLVNDLIYLIDNDPVTAGKVLVLNGVDDEHLLWLYRNCLFTLYPSLYEGWGLPIAESLGHGKYCIASNTSSMPEVGGDLVGSHDPCDVPACLRLVEEALDPGFRAAREERIRRHYRPAPWAECARQLGAALARHFGSPPARQEDRDARAATAHVPHPAAHPRGPAAGGGDLGRLSA